MVVLSIGIASLLIVLANLTNFVVVPEFLNVGTGLAEQELERVTARRYSQITDAASTPFPGSFSNFSYQIIVAAVPATLANDPAMNQYKQVEVRVRHTKAGTVSLRTVVTNN